MGIINFGNQMAGFLAPTIIGFLVQFSGGSFNSTFILLIVACLLSAAIPLSLREQPVSGAAVEAPAGRWNVDIWGKPREGPSSFHLAQRLEILSRFEAVVVESVGPVRLEELQVNKSAHIFLTPSPEGHIL
jgi:hypothetical protein